MEKGIRHLLSLQHFARFIMTKSTGFQLSAKNEVSPLPWNNKDPLVGGQTGKKNGNGSAPKGHQPAGGPLPNSDLHYRRLFETTSDGILVLNAKTGQIADANPIVEIMLGYSRDELLGRTLWEIGPLHDIAFRRLRPLKSVRYDDLTLKTGGQEHRQVEFVSNAYDVDGVKLIQYNIRDITERKLVENRVLQANEDLRSLVAGLQTREDLLREQATHDSLTGLFNRRYLDDTLTRELGLSWRRGSCLSAVILDVDHFKRINDRFGHGAGDMVLREVARILSRKLRKSDIACRFGGDEFALVLPDSTPDGTLRRVEELRGLIQRLALRYDEQLLGRVAVSAGIAAAPENAFTAPNLLRAADEALYEAKKSGRDQAHVFNSRNGSSCSFESAPGQLRRGP